MTQNLSPWGQSNDGWLYLDFVSRSLGVGPTLGYPDLNPDVNLLMQQEPRRQSCLKIDLFAGNGVVKF